MFSQKGDDSCRRNNNNNEKIAQLNRNRAVGGVANHTPGPKYLVMKRMGEGKDLSKVSSFIIHKVITSYCNSKTKNQGQTSNILKLTSFCDGVNVSVSLHRFLNISKGIIYSHALKDLKKEGILDGLKEQNMIEIRKITQEYNDQLISTPLIILTFGTANAPTELNVGFEKITTRTNIPNSIRCSNCNML